MLNFSGKQNREASSSLRFTGMTADASGMIIDTSQGKKETSEILDLTQIEHNRSDAVDRAKIALLKRQQLDEEKEDDEDDDLFGDEEDNCLVEGPQIVYNDGRADI